MTNQNGLHVKACGTSNACKGNADQEDFQMVRSQELALLDAIREGDPERGSVLSKELEFLSSQTSLGQHSIERTRTSSVIFASQACRAAIEGGMEAGEAYKLEQEYIQRITTADEKKELFDLVCMLYEDYTLRVLVYRKTKAMSPCIQRCIRYIHAHPHEKILPRDLTCLAECSEYLLTRQFAKETGLSVSDYVKQTRVERAKFLLRHTNDSIGEIAQALGYGSGNYFTRIFREETGISPSEYRSKNKRASVK